MENGITGVIPSFSIGSGNGGMTRQNGSFSTSIDYFAVNRLQAGVANLPPAPTAPAITIAAAKVRHGYYSGDSECCDHWHSKPDDAYWQYCKSADDGGFNESECCKYY